MSINEQLAADPESMKYFQRERLELEITESICKLMEEQKVTRAELARRIGTSPPYITKILRSGNNLTVNSISDIFHALNRTARFIDRPLSAKSPQLIVCEVTTAPYRLSEGEQPNYKFSQNVNRTVSVQAQPLNYYAAQDSNPVNARKAS